MKNVENVELAWLVERDSLGNFAEAFGEQREEIINFYS